MLLASFAEIFSGETLLSRLASATVQSTLLVAMVWSICRFFPRISAATRCRLWWLISLQLLIGLVLTMPLPLLPHPQMQATIAAESVSAQTSWRISVPPADSHAVEEPIQVGFGAWTDLLLGLWLAGVALMSMRTMHAWRAAQRDRMGSWSCDDPVILRMYHRLGDELGLLRLPSLRMSSTIESPQLVGPWRAMLLLPADALEVMRADQLEMVLHHELAHWRRGDLYWALLPALAQHLFFFHPLAHRAVDEYALSREAACDALVLSGQRHAPQEYGRLLLFLGVSRRPVSALPSASTNYTNLKRRLQMLQHPVSLPKISAVALTIAVIVLGVLPYRVTACMAPLVPEQHGDIGQPARRTNATDIQETNANEGPYAFSVSDGEHHIFNGSAEDRARVERRGDRSNHVLWFRKNSQEYRVSDPAVVARVRQIYVPVAQLSNEQAKLGDEQATLAAEQARQAEQMSRIVERQASVAEEYAKASVANALSGSGAERDRTDEAKLDRESNKSDQDMAKIKQQMVALDKRQSALDRDQSSLSKRLESARLLAENQTRKLLDQLVTGKQAQRLAP